jgi:hypothetical protein
MELVAAIQYHENKKPLMITDIVGEKDEYQNKLLKPASAVQNNQIMLHTNNKSQLALMEPKSIYSNNGNLVLYSLLSQNVLSKWFVTLIDAYARIREERKSPAPTNEALKRPI